MKFIPSSLLLAAAAVFVGCAAPPPNRPSQLRELDSILQSPHRPAEDRVRDPYRHPKETLEFFGVQPNMTVVEIWPGNGWYTKILAPLLREHGKLYAAQLDPAGSNYAKATVDGFNAQLAARPDLFDRVTVTTLGPPPATSAIAPAGSVDMVVTFRNLHNWMMFGWERDALQMMYRALKPGGVLGIVEHRGNPKVPQDPRAASGYVNEAHAIELIQSVGFKFVDKSEVNANPRDTKDHERGVWALPPNYANGADERERYARIGESDRFTLKFVKPKDATANAR